MSDKPLSEIGNGGCYVGSKSRKNIFWRKTPSGTWKIPNNKRRAGLPFTYSMSKFGLSWPSYNVPFQKKSIPSPWMVIGNSKGVGVGGSKSKFFRGKCEVKLKFPEGWGLGGLKPKNCQWGVCDIF